MTKSEEAKYPKDPRAIYQGKVGEWYIGSRFFWSTQSPTVESMIGGLSEFSMSDLRFTYSVLSLLKSEELFHGGRIADLGGGIGRVAFQVLFHFFDKIDIIDPIPHFLSKAREYIEKDVLIETHRVGLEDWVPSVQYDAFWAQWVMCHLTDEDLVALLKRCIENSPPGAIFFLKESVGGTSIDEVKSHYEYNSEKNSINRTFGHLVELFRDGGFSLLEYRIQPNWPPDCLMVVLFVFKKM